MAADRSPEEIQREIERARVSLASSLDQLVERTSPKRLAAQTQQALKEWALSAEGKKVLGGVAAAVVALVVINRVRARRG